MTKQRGRHISDRKFQERYEERRRRHEAQKNARQAELDAVFGRMARGELIRGGHYGQRSRDRTNRPNTWLHRPATRREISLANSEPSKAADLGCLLSLSIIIRGRADAPQTSQKRRS